MWRFFEEILPEPHAADALRSMHSLHLLTLFLPEFRAIDALAVRDVSHRFTVDEHTLRAIENLQLLRDSKFKWEQHYAGILNELDQPGDCSASPSCFMTTGKAVMRTRSHPRRVWPLRMACLDRFGPSHSRAGNCPVPG